MGVWSLFVSGWTWNWSGTGLKWLTRHALVHVLIPSFLSSIGCQRPIRLEVEVRDCSCIQLLLYFCCDVSSPLLSHDSVLKALHTDKGILTSEECSECASKRHHWYTLAAIIIATKTSDDVQRALDVARQQFPTEEYVLKHFARLLQGKTTLQLSLRNKEYTWYQSVWCL